MVLSSTSTLTTSTQVQEPSGQGPSIYGVSPNSGPQAGGTYDSSTGTIEVDGGDMNGATAVWFGQDYAAPVVSSSAAAVAVVPPPDPTASGVTLQVTTSNGASHQPHLCDVTPYIEGCPDDYFYI